VDGPSALAVLVGELLAVGASGLFAWHPAASRTARIRTIGFSLIGHLFGSCVPVPMFPFRSPREDAFEHLRRDTGEFVRTSGAFCGS
jgi:hypothetical protein